MFLFVSISITLYVELLFVRFLNRLQPEGDTTTNIGGLWFVQ